MKIVTAKQMRFLEERSSYQGVSLETLMENAGRAVAHSLSNHLGGMEGRSLIVLTGKGNNGADGLVAARYANSWGASVELLMVGNQSISNTVIGTLRDQGITINQVNSEDDLRHLEASLNEADAVADALIGIGISRPLEGIFSDVVARVVAVKQKHPNLLVLALDVPTGLDADNGLVGSLCVTADVTIALGRPKMGLYQLPGAEYAGIVEVADIGIPDGLDVDIGIDLITEEWARSQLPIRHLSSHKYDHGRTMIVAGSSRYMGAAVLAANAAGRTGAGLVTLAIPESLQSIAVSGAVEATHLPLPEVSPGHLSENAAREVLDNIDKYDSLLMGCGIGLSAGSAKLVEGILFSHAVLPPTVVDADGLNLLPQLKSDDWWSKFSEDAILTPHTGEMENLSGISSGEITDSRIPIASESAVKWNKTVVLKGAYTVVAFPNGEIMLSPYSNPGLATAGTGDVLSGILAGLLAQGLSLQTASALGVFLHGKTGDEVCNRLGESGLLAGDLISGLPSVIEMAKDRTLPNL